MEITLDVSRFQEDLRRLNLSDRKPALTKALLSAIDPTVDLAGQLAPIDTGLLSRSMLAAEDKQNRDPELVAVKFGAASKAFYWLFQEFGTAHHPAQPFLQPAIDRTVDKIENNLADSVNREIERLLN